APRRREQARQGRPVEGGREQLVQNGLARQRRDPRVDLDPPAARLEREQSRDLVDERGGCDLIALVVGDGRVDDRQLRAAELVQQPPDRGDDVLQVADEGRRRVGEAEVDVDHEQGGPLTEARPPVEPLVLHGFGMPSPARTRASASSPGSSGDQRSGVAGVGGFRPVSASQLASTSSSGGPKSNDSASPRSSRWRARSPSVAASSTVPSSFSTTPYPLFAFSGETSPKETSRATASV